MSLSCEMRAEQLFEAGPGSVSWDSAGAHWLEPDGSLPLSNLRLRRQALGVTRLIEYGAELEPGQVRLTLVGCRRRRVLAHSTGRGSSRRTSRLSIKHAISPRMKRSQSPASSISTLEKRLRRAPEPKQTMPSRSQPKGRRLPCG